MRSRTWLWFFIPLAILASVAIVIPIVYNLGLQLTSEELVKARQRWRDHGTANYDLYYTAKIDTDPEADEYWIKVRDGKVVLIVANGEVLRFDDAAGLALGLVVRTLPPVSAAGHTVEEMFDHIERQMQADAEKPGRRNYATASFDSRDGHPVRYVHRTAGTKKRLEWQIRLQRVGLPPR